MAASEIYTNKLIEEKSPYLLQHAHNPVNWYPWGEEAFEKAKRENKPILLSIGYSTCHWCHVMEKESFNDVTIAGMINADFVAIKVDREERPDIDMVYMNAVQLLTGSGGWPLTIFLTPEGVPFMGGTYYPPEDNWRGPGFKTLLYRIANLWKEKPGEISKASANILEAIKRDIDKKEGPSQVKIDDAIHQTFRAFLTAYDKDNGGFSGAPKFPRAHIFSFLLRYGKHYQNREAYEMVFNTLTQIAAGGIHDHLGGGFHRYSVDAIWRIPHFEKMLYDQAILSEAYLEAYQISKDDRYRHVVLSTLNFVASHMQFEKGGFYSAYDADSYPSDASSEKVEGAYYVWTTDEIDQVLEKEHSEIFKYAYGVEKNGNATEDPQGELKNKNTLYEKYTSHEIADYFKKDAGLITSIITESKEKLLAYRSKRALPHLDDKILTDWNGLMISAFANAGTVLNNKKFITYAKNAADFILENMMDDEGNLLHRYRDNDSDIEAFLDDYAFFILGLIDLYQATFEIKYLDQAKKLTDKMIDRFWDDQEKGFYFTSSEHEKLFVRKKEYYDGALPSGNSVSVYILLKIHRFTGEDYYGNKARELIENFLNQMVKFPLGYPQMAIALDYAANPGYEIIFAGDPKDSMKKKVEKVIAQHYLPNKIIAFNDTATTGDRFYELMPFVKNLTTLNGQFTTYICQDYTCELPATDPSMVEEVLNKQT